ncbi:MAG: DUF3048 domain-containing protein [Clostridia bacterium]|nr:DUF3048 domain-containing protein [Clostridia bacterium]
MKHSKEGKKSKKVIIISIIILLVAAISALLYFFYIYPNFISKETSVEEAEVQDNNLNVVVEEKKVQIFQGDDRPIAVMIDNHSDAWPQAGLNKAYIVYEIIVEGGETRLMAVFKGQDLEKIGPVRSSRHYFLDYAMENDAIYTHFGWSPQAESDISTYKINNINGLIESSATFWRVKDKVSPHNAVTSTKALLDVAEKRKYATTSNKKSVLNYTTDEVNLENGEDALTVTIPHSQLQTVKYIYDEENKTYKRFARNKAQTDWDTKEAVTTKNIIIEFCDNYTLTDSENKGRQGLKNIGTFDGYYITNGKAIKIKCTKESRSEQTVYKDLDGKEIKVNDGNTFVNICPINANVSIEGE